MAPSHKPLGPALELEQLLSEDIASAIHREQTTFDQFAAPLGDHLVLFGAGLPGRKTLAGLRRIGIEPLAFADTDSSKWGAKIDDVPILAPAEAVRQYREHATFVITIWGSGSKDTMADRRRQLTSFGCARVVPFVPLFWKYPDVFLPHYLWDLPHKVLEQSDRVRAAFGLWTEDASRREYVSQLRLRLLSDFDSLGSPTAEREYFPDDLVALNKTEVLVDCGAYDGDTIREFLEIVGTSFKHIVAFEPDPVNYSRLDAYVQSLPAMTREKIRLLSKAVGSREGTARFLRSGTAASSVSSNGDIDVDVASLDDVLRAIVPTYIKMDIEGSELDAISGARSLIERARPVLTICSYHRQNHLWQVPLLIQSCMPDYRFSLKSHLADAWDLVCYAVPTGRSS